MARSQAKRRLDLHTHALAPRRTASLAPLDQRLLFYPLTLAGQC